MHTIKPTSFFCIPPPGKPDPQQPPGLTPRNRVIQSGTKGDTCFYSAIQILRDEARMGKNPTVSASAERENEIQFSKLRKQITKVLEPIKSFIEFENSIKSQDPIGTTKKLAEKILNTTNIELLSQGDENKKEQLRQESNFLKGFIEQKTFDMFSSYAEDVYKKEETFIYKKFLTETILPKMGTSLSSFIIPVFDPETGGDFKPWEEATLDEQNHIAQTMFFDNTFTTFGFTRSLWNPKESIDTLIQQLELHGPHLVTGELGSSYYAIPPLSTV